MNPRHIHLVIDIGNTHTVLGLFAESKLLHSWRFNTQKTATGDEISLILNLIQSTSLVKLNSESSCAISNVVPAVGWAWRKAIYNSFKIEPQFLNSENCKWFQIDYKYPDQLGADRLANILGCQALGITDAIVIDFGTATTYDVYGNNTYFGGIICPGVYTSLSTLIEKTSRLADVELYWNKTIIGKTTDDALRNGILFSVRGQISFCLQAIQAEVSLKNPQIIATGGIAPLISKGVPEIHRLERDITLIGLSHFLNLREKKA